VKSRDLIDLALRLDLYDIFTGFDLNLITRPEPGRFIFIV
jgi:hypothetical protein